jgi:hypothetical protein
MSLYNMVFGMNANLAVIMSPFLPQRADTFPRFRDIFTEAEDAPVKGDIYIYTRMGGGNRECWEEGKEDCDCCACNADKIEDLDECLYRYDDDFDRTFCTFVFKVKDERREDFNLVALGKLKETSDWYKETLRNMFADSQKISALIDEICVKKAT